VDGLSNLVSSTCNPELAIDATLEECQAACYIDKSCTAIQHVDNSCVMVKDSVCDDSDYSAKLSNTGSFVLQTVGCFTGV
jgi:hypothetical protein